MKNTKSISILKHILRVVISCVVALIAISLYDFTSFYRLILFLGIYIVVSMFLEFIFNKFIEK